MDRRLFVVGALAWAIPSFPAALRGNWKAGTHYVMLPAKLSTSLPVTGIEVVEVFSYTCIHCYRFEPYMREWLREKPGYVNFTRMPGVWTDWQRPYACLYYALQILGRNDLDHDVFDAIHLHKSLPMRDPKEIYSSLLKFAQNHEIGESDFVKAYDSAAVKSQLQGDAERVLAYQVAETPSMVVNRKYETDVSRVIQSSENSGEAAFSSLIQLVTDLVAAEALTLRLPSPKNKRSALSPDVGIQRL
jgi:protein dithiol oxidoreductase (disulfide-forming)